jgi:hypothetical protein
VCPLCRGTGWFRVYVATVAHRLRAVVLVDMVPRPCVACTDEEWGDETWT